MKDWYAILQVREDASAEIIGVAYKTLSKKYHPDLNHDKPNPKFYLDKMKDLNEAKNILLNVERRKIYDKELNDERNRAKIIINPKPQHQPQYQPQHKEPDEKKITFLDAVIYLLKNNPSTLIICGLIFAFGVFLVAFNIDMFVKTGVNAPQPPSTPIEEFVLTPGVSIDDIVAALGRPNKHATDHLIYGKSKIIIEDNYVKGWVDTFQTLPIDRYTKIPEFSDLTFRETKSQILAMFGFPDTYSDNLFVYNDVIVFFEKDIVKRIEKI